MLTHIYTNEENPPITEGFVERAVVIIANSERLLSLDAGLEPLLFGGTDDWGAASAIASALARRHVLR